MTTSPFRRNVFSMHCAWLFLLLINIAGLTYAAPTALEVLEGQLAITTRQLAAVQATLANQKTTVQAAQRQAERATIAALRASRYPAAFWGWQSVLGHAPAPSVIGAMARQQGRETARIKAAYSSLFALYGQAQAKQSQLVALRQNIARTAARTESRTARRQRAALAKAGLDASLLAVQLAKQLGEAPPPPPPTPAADSAPKFAPQSVPNAASKLAQKPAAKITAKPTMPPTETLREAAPLPTLAMEEAAPHATPPAAPTAAKNPARWPLQGPVLVKYKQGEGAEAEGVVLGGSAGAPVVSPVTGKVLFAGEFRQFGGLVIVQGRSGHDEVLGGLGQLQVAANQRVQSASPLGSLGQRGRLYWEVRQRGTPRNPLTFKR